MSGPGAVGLVAGPGVSRELRVWDVEFPGSQESRSGWPGLRGFGGPGPAPPGMTRAYSPAAGLPAGLQPYDRALLPPLCLQPQLPPAHGPRGVVPGQLRGEAGPCQPPPDGRLRGTDAGAAAAPRSRARVAGGAIRTPGLP